MALPAMLVPMAANIAGRGALAAGTGMGFRHAMTGGLKGLFGLEVIDQVLEGFGLDLIPDLSNPQEAAEYIVEAADGILESDPLVPTRQPGWARNDPDWENMPGRYFVWDYGMKRAFYKWTLITKKQMDARLAAALRPAATVRSAPKRARR